MKEFIIILLLTATISAEAQNVGIGTVNPNYPLDINGRMRLRNNGATSGIWFNKADNTEAAFSGMFNDTIIGFYGNNGWRIGVDVKNERLGIGNFAPTAALSFAATLGKKISLYRGATGDAGFGVFGNELRINSDYSGADISFGYDNLINGFTENMRIKGNGMVGIGFPNPTATLTVARGTAVGGTARFNGTVNASHFNINTTEDTYIRGGKADSKVFINDPATAGDVILSQSSGNVGIGTATPGAKLDVAGAVKIADGTQGDGKVLTSDANGNASWESSAYGNKERFQYSLREEYTGPTINITPQRIYNYGTVIASYPSINSKSGIQIKFPSAGLYHFDLNGNIYYQQKVDGNGLSLNLLLPSGGIRTQTFGGTVNTLTNSYGSLDKSFDLYIEAGQSYFFQFDMEDKTHLYNQVITVTGHKIAD